MPPNIKKNVYIKIKKKNKNILKNKSKIFN